LPLGQPTCYSWLHHVYFEYIPTNNNEISIKTINRIDFCASNRERRSVVTLEANHEFKRSIPLIVLDARTSGTHAVDLVMVVESKLMLMGDDVLNLPLSAQG
jgi:hypothetical protein